MIRLKVRLFAEQMERKLRLNDNRSGWAKCHRSYLLRRLRCEVNELEEALINGHFHNITKEAADVANFAMMIADVCGGLKEK